jgi:acylphosphatase
VWFTFRSREEGSVKTVKAIIRGKVQGVGYRYWAERAARTEGVSGTVRNRRDGAVELVVSGDDGRVDALLAKCRAGPALAEVSGIDVSESDWSGTGFSILPTG